jgi:hypothetical protein
MRLGAAGQMMAKYFSRPLLILPHLYLVGRLYG